MNNNFLAIIILTHNKKNDVLECLKSVYIQDYKNFQVFVVDNASTDGSAKAIRTEYPSVPIFINEVNRGAGPGRNTGWNFAQKNIDCEYLLFLDDDVILENNYISKLIDLLNTNPDAGITCGKAYTDKKLKIIMSTGINVNLFNGSIYDIGSGKEDIGQFDHSGYVDACGGFAMMMRSELFSSIGGFNENYAPYGWEDVDLCLQAKRKGYYTYYLSDAILIHKGTKLGRKPNPMYEKNKVKNYIYFLKNNTTLFQKITCTFCLPFRAFILALKLILNGNGKIIIEHFKGFFIGINNLRLSIKSK